MTLDFSEGVVVEANDAEGWICVQWVNGSENKYRYNKDAHDVQLLNNGFRAAAAAAAETGHHLGRWRSNTRTRYHCSIPNQTEGPLCTHEGGILQAHPVLSSFARLHATSLTL
jgi:hypothetical protein